MRLTDLSQAETNMPCQPEDYEDTAHDIGLARREISSYLNVPTEPKYIEQRDLLDGKQRENWIKFTKKAREMLDLEVLLHQYTSVTELGWDPASGNCPRQLTRDGKLRGNYLLTAESLMVLLSTIFQLLLSG